MEAGEHHLRLIDSFPDDFLIMVDESHVTIPQIRAMYNGDRARKESLIEYGFRLPSALIIDRFNSMNSWSVSIKSSMYRQRLVHTKWKYKRMWQSKLFVLPVYLDPSIEIRLLRDKWMTCLVKFISDASQE